MKYRREIDGLRAIAVLAVMFFHAGFSPFHGGFIGVDVFFVISGHLITTLILNEHQSRHFRFVNFYERRARRIFPALLLISSTCIPFAWFWLLPGDMKLFSQSLVAIAGFSSNILFWRKSGYFEPDAFLQPLLHTWSLGVEEQYYLIFPALLIAVWRLRPAWRGVLLIGIGLTSLGVAQSQALTQPSASFYLLHTRAWEFLLGTLTALYCLRSPAGKHHLLTSNIASASGLGLVLYATFAFDERTVFPGLSAVVPTLGTALIIAFSHEKTVVGKVLGTRLLVGIGLISYSAYLWHQPLFAFAHRLSPSHPPPSVMGALMLGALALAYLSWRFVETPFRNRRKVSRQQILIFSIVGGGLLFAIGLMGHLSQGFRFRVADDQAKFVNHFENSAPQWRYFIRENILTEYRTDCGFFDLDKYREGNQTLTPLKSIPEACFQRDSSHDKAVFLWGDSHVQHLRPGLSQTLPDNWQILQVASAGCSPEIHDTANSPNYCDYSNWFARQSISDSHPDVVIIGQNMKHDISQMATIRDELTRIGIKKILFIGPTPHWKPDLPKVVAYRLWINTPQRSFVGINPEAHALNDKLKRRFNETANIRLLSVIDYFCNSSGCIVYIGDDKLTGITSWDYGHLTPLASLNFARDVLADAVTEAPR